MALGNSTTCCAGACSMWGLLLGLILSQGLGQNRNFAGQSNTQEHRCRLAVRCHGPGAARLRLQDA